MGTLKLCALKPDNSVLQKKEIFAPFPPKDPLQAQNQNSFSEGQEQTINNCSRYFSPRYGLHASLRHSPRSPKIPHPLLDGAAPFMCPAGTLVRSSAPLGSDFVRLTPNPNEPTSSQMTNTVSKFPDLSITQKILDKTLGTSNLTISFDCFPTGKPAHAAYLRLFNPTLTGRAADTRSKRPVNDTNEGNGFSNVLSSTGLLKNSVQMQTYAMSRLPRLNPRSITGSYEQKRFTQIIQGQPELSLVFSHTFCNQH